MRLATAVLSFALSLSPLAFAQEARVPVKLYLVSPEDRPDVASLITAGRPVTHETKHMADTWGGQLYDYLDVGADCQPTDVNVTVVTPPGHGSLFLNQAKLPNVGVWAKALPKDDPRAACRILPSRGAHYMPDPNFVGRDKVVVSFQEGDASFTDTIDIVVRRAEHPSPLRPAG